MANTIVRGDCFRCGRVKNLRWNHALDRGECRACRARRSPQEACTGCGKQRRVNARTSDGGALCVTCYARTRTADDACAECGSIGPLATRVGGKFEGSRNLCSRCYRNPRRPCGICGRLKRVALKATATTPDVCPTCYQAPVIDCSICGQQALGRRTTNHGRPRCFACQATQQIDAALSGPDGTINPELKPVRDALNEFRQPRSLLNNWHDLPSLHLLAEIAQGRLDLSHDALDARPQTFSVTYLRSMLVATGALPPRDENAARLHRYAAEALANIADPEQRGVLIRYARWHVVGRAKTNRHGYISAAVTGRCKGDIQAAKGFFDHLTAHGQTLSGCSQGYLDAWLATDRDRRLGFLRWLTRNGYLAGCRLPEPVRQKDPAHDADPSAQTDAARTLLHDPDSASIEDRAAACLILLYAQPAAKIVTLTTDDIEVRDGDTYLALGPESLLLVPPLDALITALPVTKLFGTASTLADVRWLFTGKSAGSHLHPASLMRRMHRLGIIARTGRNTALLHLASTTPPAVFASLIGIHVNTATRWAEMSGSAWNAYAAIRR
ncbi:MAG TPA: hypothetical protein PKJ61_10040 [Propionicimonas sp.]|nr:hypothetical protein [Propionicimonas sp.]